MKKVADDQDISKNMAMNCKLQATQGNIFLSIHKRLTLLPGLQGLNVLSQMTDNSQTYGVDGATPLEVVRREAENMAVFIVRDSINDADKRPPNRYCKAMKKTVLELSNRHDVLFNSMVKKLNITQESAFLTFVNVADEIFMDGKISWGRIIAVYTFTAHFAKYCQENEMPDYPNKIALYAGKYVGKKMGHWMLENGGWEAFADYFSDPASSSDSLWKGLLVTAALGTLAVVATR